MHDDGILYDKAAIDFLEELWGDGFLSPGGKDEVNRVLEGIDLRGLRVLDIGSGSGACAILFVSEHGAASTWRTRSAMRRAPAWPKPECPTA